MNKTIGMVLLALLPSLLACGEAAPAPKSGEGETGGAGGNGNTAGTMSMGASGATGGSSATGSGGGGSGSAGSGMAGSGSEPDASSGAGGGAPAVDGGTNNVPADYKGKPFPVEKIQAGKLLQIPGNIHMADYDLGGAGVAYCHGNAANCAAGIKMTDWDCGPGKGGDHRLDPNCPPYRPNDDNAGLCHMNTGEPDNTTTGQTYSPYYPYLCYTATGEWTKYTVEVTQAGTYSVGGAMAVPTGVNVELDFGNGITTGSMVLPTSPTAMCKCPETYHSWETVTNLGMVTFPSAGTYLMTMTIKSQQYNPDFFTFTKM